MAFQFTGTVIIPSEEFFTFLYGQKDLPDSEVIYSLEKSYISRINQELVLVSADDNAPDYFLDLVSLWEEFAHYHPNFQESTFYGVPYLLAGDIAVDMVASSQSHDVMLKEVGAPLQDQWQQPSQHSGEYVFFLNRHQKAA